MRDNRAAVEDEGVINWIGDLERNERCIEIKVEGCSDVSIRLMSTSKEIFDA